MAQPVDVDPQDQLGAHRAGHAGDVAEGVERAVELVDDGVDRRRVGQVAAEVAGGALRRVLHVERGDLVAGGDEPLQRGVPMPVDAPVSRTRFVTARPTGRGTRGSPARGGRRGGAASPAASNEPRCGASSRNTARSSQRARLAPEAEVLAEPEREVEVRVAADVEAVRVGELALVPVGRRVPQGDGVAGPDRDVAELDVGDRGAGELDDRRRPPQDLLGRRLDEAGRVGGQPVAARPGASSSAWTPPVMALRVVSLPAPTSSTR